VSAEGMNTVVVVVVVAMMLGLAAGDSQPSSGFIHCVSSEGGVFAVDITWQINNDVICFTLSSECDDCWLGLGLNTDGRRQNEMENGDFYVATFTDPGPDGNFIAVSDLFLGPVVGPPSNDLSNPKCFYNAIVPPYSASQVDGVTTFSFCRLLVTGDSTCDNDIIQNKSMVVLCAHGKSNVFDYHGSNRGFTQNYSFTGQIHLDTDSTGLVVVEKTYATFVAWHACMMFLAFGILLPFGLFIARFLKSFWWWFPLHIAVQILSVTLTFIAFTLIVLETPEKVSFTFWHSYIGLAALILIWFSPFLGLISHFMWDPNRSSIPLFPDKIHWYVGRLGILVGFAAIYLGIYRLESNFSEGTLVAAYVFSILLVFYVACLITVSIAQRFKDTGYDTIQ